MLTKLDALYTDLLLELIAELERLSHDRAPRMDGVADDA